MVLLFMTGPTVPPGEWVVHYLLEQAGLFRDMRHMTDHALADLRDGIPVVPERPLRIG